MASLYDLQAQQLLAEAELRRLSREIEKAKQQAADPLAQCATIESQLNYFTPEGWDPDFSNPLQEKWLPLWDHRSNSLAIQSAQQAQTCPSRFYRPKDVWKTIIAQNPLELKTWLVHEGYA